MSSVVSPEYCELHGHVLILCDLDALRDHWIFILKQYKIPLNLLFWSVIMIISWIEAFSFWVLIQKKRWDFFDVL